MAAVGIPVALTRVAARRSARGCENSGRTLCRSAFDWVHVDAAVGRDPPHLRRSTLLPSATSWTINCAVLAACCLDGLLWTKTSAQSLKRHVAVGKWGGEALQT